MTETYGVIQHTDYVNIRKTPGGTIIRRLYPGNSLTYDAETTYSQGGKIWYQMQFDGDAYIMAKYVAKDTADHTVMGTIHYDGDSAERYARNHTENTGAMTKPSNNNNAFGFTKDQNCTNFVSQCLCAGGLPMFDGWARSFAGIPSTWNKKGWTLTNRTRCSLIAKGWMKEIPYTQVQKGDIIFNYRAGNTVHLRYPHVVLAAGSYDAGTGKVPVHGHTENRRNWAKPLTASNCRCYRIASDIPLQACEKLAALPMTGSGATVQA